MLKTITIATMGLIKLLTGKVKKNGEIKVKDLTFDDSKSIINSNYFIYILSKKKTNGFRTSELSPSKNGFKLNKLN